MTEPAFHPIQEILEEIRDGLAAIYPDMDTAAFAEVLQAATAAAQLAGRFEVTQDA